MDGPSLSAATVAASPERAALTPSVRRSDIQGMRGLAVLVVVLFHAEIGGFAGGFVGVDVFFVLSGFVITRLLDRELLATGRVDFNRFYVRRIRRLLPASAVLLAGVAVMSAFLLSPLGPQQTAASTGTAASLFSANAYLYVSPAGYFDAPALLNPLLHMWSLAVEEQFYVVFPLLLMVTWRVVARSGRDAASVRLRVAAVFALFAVGSFAVSLAVSYANGPFLGIQDPAQLAFYASPVRAWEFIAGALLALAVTQLDRIPAPVERFVGLFGLVLVLLATFTLDETVPWPGMAALLPVVGTVFMILGGTRGTGVASMLLSTKPMVWLGDLSYSWYLWHWPAIVFARSLAPGNVVLMILAAVLSIGPAWLSYRLVEEPVRHADWLRGRRVVLLAAVCILTPIVAFAGLRFGAQKGWGSDNIAAVESLNGLHLDQQNQCGTITVAEPGERCHFEFGSDADSSARIVLIGDSSAGQYSEVMVAASEAVGRPLDIVTRHGCPFAPLDFAPSSFAVCQDFAESSIEQLLADPPAVAVIATALDGYLRESIDWRLPGESGDATDLTAKSAAWSQAWGQALSDLEAAGTTVIVMAPNPRFDDWFLSGCPMVKLAADTASCGTSAPREELLDARSDALATIVESVEGTQVHILDLFEELCPGEICTTNDGDAFRYRDGVHLSVPGSLELTPTFVAALESALLDSAT